MASRLSRACLIATLVVCLAPSTNTQSQSAPITSPKEQFGFNIGDDYVLANYSQTEAYWKKLDAESDRMSLVDIGRTEEGRAYIIASNAAAVARILLEHRLEARGVMRC